MSAGRKEDGSLATSRSTGRLGGSSAAALNPRPAAAVAPSGAHHSKTGGGLQPLQQKLQQHIDREDRRIKRLTEAILYDFLPAALRAVAAGEAEGAAVVELTPEKCRAVAGAALGVASLMNAPPGFLEFLLCVPWKSLGQMYPGPLDPCTPAPAVATAAASWQAPAPLMPSPFQWTTTGVGQEGAAGGAPPPKALGSNGDPAPASPAFPVLEVSQEEREAIVNLPLDPRLMPCVLGFLLRAEHAENLPPMLRCAPLDPLAIPSQEALQAPLPTDRTCSQEDSLAAFLDCCTPLHCAAVRGNPALVSHLLSCGANPLATNAAGELPLESVPVCGDRCVGRKPSCRCMPPGDQEAWECRSRLSRTLIVRRCVLSWGLSGLSAWLRIVVLCLLCLLGLWGHNTSLHRASLATHLASRRERRRQAVLQSACSALQQMRTNAAEGRAMLAPLQQQRSLGEELAAEAAAGSGDWLQTGPGAEGGGGMRGSRAAGTAGRGSLKAGISPLGERGPQMPHAGLWKGG